MSSKCAHVQSWIFRNLGAARLKTPLYYALVILLDVDKDKSMKLEQCHWPKYLSLKRQISQTSLGLCCSHCCEYVQGRFPLVLNRSGVWKWLYCSQTGWSEFLLFSNVRRETSAATWLKQACLHSVHSQRASVYLWALPGSLQHFFWGLRRSLVAPLEFLALQATALTSLFFSGADLLGIHHSVDV